MTIIIIQGIWKEGNKKLFFIMKMLVATWCFEILDYVLGLQAYLH
jgi:hypothetical protein